ncbi:MAG: hypothetical protein K940chlam8_00820 [Chlamydiae bacterium]|nr:hypothetical protein [Chlamydiota bacterium]
MTQWYVVQVLSGQEDKVKKQVLENRASVSGMLEDVEDVLVPKENVAEVKAGQQKISEKRIWPGYILIKMNLTDEVWHYIKSINGIVDFLGGAKPAPLAQKEVDEILQDLEQKKEKVTHKHKLEIGEKVKITDGVFINFIGQILEVYHEKGRLSVMVSIFGRDTRVDDLEFWQVEKIEEDVNG